MDVIKVYGKNKEQREESVDAFKKRNKDQRKKMAFVVLTTYETIRVCVCRCRGTSLPAALSCHW